MQKLVSFTFLLLGSTLLLMAAVVIMIPQDSMGVSELWALIETEGDYADGLSLLNQHTGHESELVRGHVGSVIGVARDGSALLYTDGETCGDGGCIPTGTLLAVPTAGGEPRMMGQLRLGDQPLNRSHNGRWYAHVNSYNEVSLIREDGRERRLLAELPSKLSENWLSYWSPDDEWLYMVSGLQPQRYTEQSAFIRVYRMRIDEGIMELVTEFHSLSGRAFHVSNDWLILLAIDDEGSARLFRMRSDGSEFSDGVEIDDELLAYNYWIGSLGAIFAYKGGNYGGVPMYHINSERALVESVVYGGDGSVLVDIGLPQVSSDGRYLAASYTAPSERGIGNVADWVVLDDTGGILLQEPIRWCVGLGILWVDNLVYAGEAVDTECRRLLYYRPGDRGPRVAQEFPKQAVSVTLLPTDYPEWIAYILDDTWYVTNWYGSETYPLRYSREGSVQGWLTIPLPETDKRTAIPIGFGLIFVAGLSARYTIVRR